VQIFVTNVLSTYTYIAIRVKNSNINNYINDQESSYEKNEIVQLYY